MPETRDYGQYETAWCPGCGNHSILAALKSALARMDLAARDVLLVSGIGQAAKTPHYLDCNFFNGLHGRSLPAAAAAKAANPALTVIAESGDGCSYGEGGNHFLAAIRRNPDITLIVHDNQVYGLTKGQASPTSPEGFVTKAQPLGATSSPFNPLAVAVAMEASFVARGFAGNQESLADLMVRAVTHRGFALLDVLQPCVTFNRINTWRFYQERCVEIKDHDPADWEKAMRLARQWGDEIPIGVIFKREKPTFADHFPALKKGPLVNKPVDLEALKKFMESFA